jgi:hypothetical protein
MSVADDLARTIDLLRATLDRVAAGDRLTDRDAHNFVMRATTCMYLARLHPGLLAPDAESVLGRQPAVDGNRDPTLSGAR